MKYEELTPAWYIHDSHIWHVELALMQMLGLKSVLYGPDTVIGV